MSRKSCTCSMGLEIVAEEDPANKRPTARLSNVVIKEPESPLCDIAVVMIWSEKRAMVP